MVTRQTLQAIRSLEDFEVVSLLAVILDLLFHCRATDPSYVIFHRTRHVESRVSDSVDTDLDVPLLNIHDSVLDRLCHLHSLHEDRQASSSEGAHIDLLTGCEALTRINHTHFVQLIGKLLGFGHSVIIILAESLELGDKLCDLSN